LHCIALTAAACTARSIEAYISSDNPAAADRFLAVLTDRFKVLADMPRIGRRRDKFASGVRSISEGNYVILYRVKNDAMEILRVLHGARDPERVISETPIEE
jgi:toxin ParE1/3/4